VFPLVQQFAQAKQSFQNVADGMEERRFAVSKCVSVEPSILVLLAEHPVAILNGRANESFFLEFTACKGKAPCCASVVALNRAGGYFRELSAPGPILILNRDEPLCGSPHGNRVPFLARLLVGGNPSKQNLSGVEYGGTDAYVHHSAADSAAG